MLKLTLKCFYSYNVSSLYSKWYTKEEVIYGSEVLTLILLELKVISLWPGQLAHPCSLTMLYTVGWPSFHILITLKIIVDISKTWRWIIPFKKFSRLRIKVVCFRLDWPVRTMSFSHDGKMLAAASEDLVIDISEVDTGIWSFFTLSLLHGVKIYSHLKWYWLKQ